MIRHGSDDKRIETGVGTMNRELVKIVILLLRICTLLLVRVCRRSNRRGTKQRILTSLSSQLPSIVGVLSSVVGENRDGQTPQDDGSCFGRCKSEALVHGRVHGLPSVERRVGLVWVVSSASHVDYMLCVRKDVTLVCEMET